MQTLALLHTGPVVIKPINDIVRSLMPDLRVVNLMDDSIVPEIYREGRITAPVHERLGALARCALAAGAEAIVVTCSSISEMTGPMAESVGLPVFKIDEAMAIEAVRRGPRIGVVATLPTTLAPTCRLIESRAAELGATITLHRELCDDAFDELSRGHPERHDALLRAAIDRLSATQDVIVLAQASMARLLEGRDPDFGTPVLTSPLLGITRVRDQLRERGLLAR
ncbi:MAG TPA: aspartate/glutamate racemase family protein [Burkholderiaceae bacterium]|nr:aspartate/glutamate racemase family protein [Burkholderiaceae bacterium]